MNSSNYLSENRDDVYSFINSNFNYYIPLWERIEKEGRIFSWNWASFLFFPFWLFYRKMYFCGIIYSLIYCFINTILSLIINPLIKSNHIFEIIILICTYIIMSLSGVLGNWIYYKHTVINIKKNKRKYKESDSIKNELSKSGGTSNISIFLFPLIYIIPQIIIDFIETNML